MSTVLNIRDITRTNRVVYYPELGYMVSKQGMPVLPGNAWIEHAVSEHLSRIRSLSLYFDKVFIPLSHVLIADHPVTLEVHDRLLAHHDFKALIDYGVLLAGTWGADNHEALIDHQRDFIHEIDWPVSPCLSLESMASLNCLPIAVRDVNIQIADLRRGIMGYLDLQHEPGMATVPLQISDSVKRCEYKDLPFVHEIFWQRLKMLQIPHAYKVGALQETNRIYFEAGETGNPGIILYHVPGSEPQIRPRIAKTTKISCLVYHPEVFLSFLSMFLDAKQINILLHKKDILEFLALRGDCWRVFMRKYHDLLSELEALLPSNMEGILTDRTRIGEIIRKQMLNQPTIDCSAAITFFITILDLLVQALCSGYDKTPIKQAADVVKNPLVTWLENVIMRSKQGEIYEFMTLIKRALA
jgi:hypothetical protein